MRELQDSVKLLGKVLNYKELSGDESFGLLKIIADYAYALDISSLKIIRLRTVIKGLLRFYSFTSLRRMVFCLTSMGINE